MTSKAHECQWCTGLLLTIDDGSTVCIHCGKVEPKRKQDDACGKIGQNRTPVSDLRRSAPNHSSVVAEEG